MDYKEKYEQGLECLEEILNSGQEKIKITLLKERLLPFFPELESEDERMKKKCINFLNLHKRFHASSAEIDECIAWLEKQGEKKVPSVDFKAKDYYVSEVDGKIHDMTYNPADNVEKKEETKSKQEILDNWYVEYVYILDYSTGRVIVTKHDVKEPISELFEQLGLKENQCHYMVSNTILSIEYINF